MQNLQMLFSKPLHLPELDRALFSVLIWGIKKKKKKNPNCFISDCKSPKRSRDERDSCLCIVSISKKALLNESLDLLRSRPQALYFWGKLRSDTQNLRYLMEPVILYQATCIVVDIGNVIRIVLLLRIFSF